MGRATMQFGTIFPSCILARYEERFARPASVKTTKTSYSSILATVLKVWHDS